MKRILPPALVLLALAAGATPGRATFGWPPPGYSATGVNACDGSHYRGLCELLRDRLHGRRAGCAATSPAPCGPCSAPANGSGSAFPQAVPQPPTAPASPRP